MELSSRHSTTRVSFLTFCFAPHAFSEFALSQFYSINRLAKICQAFFVMSLSCVRLILTFSLLFLNDLIIVMIRESGKT